MSPDRRFEYDKGPRLEDDAERPTDGSESDDDGSDPGPRDDSSGVGRPVAAVTPWKAGLAAGASAFAVVFAAVYQMTAAMDATGLFGAENEPSRWMMTGLTALANHGATIERGGEPIEAGFTYSFVGGLASHVTALVPAAVLLAAGYLLVRSVRLETRREAGLAIGAFVASYTVLMVGLAAISRWTPENGEELEPITVAIDAASAFSITRTALVFVLIGAAIAALPRLLEAAPIESIEETD